MWWCGAASCAQAAASHQCLNDCLLPAILPHASPVQPTWRGCVRAAVALYALARHASHALDALVGARQPRIRAVRAAAQATEGGSSRSAPAVLASPKPAFLYRTVLPHQPPQPWQPTRVCTTPCRVRSDKCLSRMAGTQTGLQGMDQTRCVSMAAQHQLQHRPCCNSKEDPAKKAHGSLLACRCIGARCAVRA